MTAPMANMVIAMTDIDSRATPDAALAAVGIAAATARNVKVFNLYIVVLIVTAFVVAYFTWLVWDAGNKVQDAVQSDADARILEARNKAATLETDLNTEKIKLLELQKDVANAQAAQQRVEIDLAKQREIAANAERSLLELRERIKPRKLTDEQSAEFVTALKTFPETALKLGYTAGGGDEAFNLLKQLMSLFKEARWKIPIETSQIVNHLEVQVIGVGLLMPGPEGFDPSKPSQPEFIRLTPAETALQAAFKKAGIELQFLRWYPNTDKTPELVIGSKPNP